MNLPLETWYAIAGAAASLLVGAAHRRGHRLPLLEVLLDLLHGDPRPTPKESPMLERILEELRKRLPLRDEK